jgi:histone acetyltransferase (RNA polymerase elongator complex component)
MHLYLHNDHTSSHTRTRLVSHAAARNGHPIDKIEMLVLGGTWSSYPHEYGKNVYVRMCVDAYADIRYVCVCDHNRYQETYIRDLFFAANTFSAFR